MLTGIHILLTYRCTNECDHCFVFGSPWAEGAFTLAQVRTVLDEAVKIGTIETVFFEGGEAFLYYPLLLEGVRLAKGLGFGVGIVTNGFFGTTEEDARLWLKPLVDLGLGSISISDDAFHSADADCPAKRVLAAAVDLGLSPGCIAIEPPAARCAPERKKGEPIAGGGVRFRGRAAERLTQGLPTVPWEEFVACPHETLAEPGRVHIDAYGNVLLCQGISMGNAWETPLSQLAAAYSPERHPIVSALLQGGPAELARRHLPTPEAGYVDACHLCYTVRKTLVDRFRRELAPLQLYGL